MWVTWIPLLLLVEFSDETLAEGTTETHGAENSVHSTDKKRQDLIPYPRTGRASHQGLQISRDPQKELSLKEMEDLQNQRLILVQSGSEKFHGVPDGNEVRKGSIFTGSEYILPYPRPGRNVLHENDGNIYDDQIAVSNELMFPQLRMGRSKGQNTMFPYPIHEDSQSASNKNANILEKNFNEAFPSIRKGQVGNFEDTDILGQYITPYPRLGKRNDENSVLLPYPRLGRNTDFLTPYPRLGKRISGDLLPYPRPGRDNDFLTPYPRLGKRVLIDLLPYPRPGRSLSYKYLPEKHSDFQQFLLENSDYLTPYPRIGKRQYADDVMIPYPRVGRSSSDDPSETSIYITPYPRIGKRENDETLLPYPRVGRSQQDDQTASDDDEYPAQYITPYPRIGRGTEKIALTDKEYSQLLKELTKGTWDTLLPYLRPGRSEDNDDVHDENTTVSVSFYVDEGADKETMIPNPRFGRSKSSFISHVRERRDIDSTAENQILLPYPRLGRSAGIPTFSPVHSNMNPYITVYIKNRKDSDARIDTVSDKYLQNSADSSYILPYPRPGRSQNLPNSVSRANFKKFSGQMGKIANPELSQDSNSNEFYLLPYPRPGRTLMI